MKPPYTTYITRHPSAVAHLNALPQTLGLTAYLAQTHTLAQSYTHAWDLPSLLIKPVQRLLKYPLLLAAIMNDTEPGEAKDMLREARDKVEEVARGVNEGRRRWDVVKNLLDGKHPPPVRLKSMKVLKHRTGSKDGQGQLEELEKVCPTRCLCIYYSCTSQRVHACEVFVQDFAKDIVDWSMSLRDFISQLERWSATFGRVIGLGQSSHGSEALDLFIDIVTSQISPIWISLDTAIQTTLLPKLARLLATTAQPLLLLEHMHALRPQHIQLLEAPVSKTRPPNSLVEASQSYLALEAQLRTELPKYIQILERGFTVCLGQFTEWQARFWKEIRAQWVELWDALSIEGDMTAGAADTVKVWWERWEEIDAAAGRLGITRPKRDRSSRASHASHASQTTGLGPGVGAAAALATAFVAGPVGPASTLSRSPTSPTSPTIPRPRRHSIQSIDLEIDTRLHGGSRGSGSFSPSPMHDAVVASSESYASFGVDSKRERKSRPVAGSPIEARSSLQHDGNGGGDKLPLMRRESERLPFRRRDTTRQKAAAARNQPRDGGRLPVVRVDSERALAMGGGRPEISLPVTARLSAMRSTMSNLKGEEGEWGVGVDGGGNGYGDLGSSLGSAAERTRARISKKTSIDSTASRSSPRVSIHTHTSSESGIGTGSGSGSGVSNHRLSMQSIDVHIGMDVYASPPPPPPPPPLSRTYENELGTLTNGHGSSPTTPSSAASASPSSQNPKQTGSIPVRNTHVDEDLEARGRVLKKPSIRKRFADAFRSPSKRPTGAGAGAGGGTFTVLEHPTLSSPTSPSVPDPALLSPASASASVPEYEQEYGHAYDHAVMQHQLPDTVLYTCAVVHPFVLPPSDGVLPLYRGLSFLAPLQVGDTIAVLSEEGHPRDHSGLPIQPAPEEEEREECLLLGRDEQGGVGWALASFLVILS